MAAAHGDPDELVIAQVARRWQALDPLLPVPSIPAAADGERFTAGPPGAPTAVGGCGHWAGTPGTLEMCWGAARRFELTARVGGQDVTEALDQLLTAWHDHVAVQPGVDDEDTAAVVSWPSRDVEGIIALLHHGLQPLAVVAVRSGPPGFRLTNEPANGVPELPPGLQIRRAGPADLDTVVPLEHLVVRYDAHFGEVVDRPWTADALRTEAKTALAAAEPWVWLAERDGQAVGVLHAQRPADAGWIAPLTRPEPVAYNLLTGVSATERGAGVGAALTARFHTEAQAAGVAVNLLHYTQVNPRSVPFWSQQGYRPLWTIWEAHPASSLR